MKKYPSISRIGSESTVAIEPGEDTEAVVLEKIDGDNFRWMLTESGELVFGSRNAKFTDHGTPLGKDEISGRLTNAAATVESAVHSLSDKEQEKVSNLVFFGEATRFNRVKYDWGKSIPSPESHHPCYVGFDIWNPENEDWLAHSQVQKYHEMLGLETTPMCGKLSISQLHALSSNISDESVPASEYRTPDSDAVDPFNEHGLAEGIIIKLCDGSQRWKYHHTYMKEVSKFGTPRDGESVDELRHRKQNAYDFVDTFVTEARVHEVAQAMVSDPKYDYEETQMKMMKDLPKAVIADIMQEEGANIILNEFDIELTQQSKAEIRNEVSDACSTHLKSILN